MKYLSVFALSAASLLFSQASFAETETVPGVYDLRIAAESGSTNAEGLQKDIRLTASLYDIISYTEWERESAYIDDLDCDDEGDPSIREDVWSRWDLKSKIKGIKTDLEAAAVYDALFPKIFGDTSFSWNVFKERLARLEMERELYGLWERVCSEHAESNAYALGYLVEMPDVGDIEDDFDFCSVEQSYRSVYRPVTKKKKEHLRDDRVSFDIDYSNLVLLSDETAYFKISFDGKNVKILPQYVYNNYTAEYDRSTSLVKIQGSGRNAQTRSEDFNTSFAKNGTDIRLSITDKRSAVLGDYSVQISGTIMKDPKGCGKKAVQAGTFSSSFPSGQAMNVSLTQELGSLEADASYWISGLQITRVNTEYFTGSASVPAFDRVKNK